MREFFARRVAVLLAASAWLLVMGPAAVFAQSPRGAAAAAAYSGDFSDLADSDVTTLPDVTVRDSRTALDEAAAALAGGQVARGARMGLLGTTDVMDTPFSVTSYTDEAIRNMQAQSMADLLAADPAVRSTTGRGHLSETIRIRGFTVGASDYAFNGMFGVAPSGRVFLEAVERSEVIKGPSAALFGMSPGGSVGGVVNLVPKRAHNEPITRLNIGLRQDSVLSTHADIGRRFGQGGMFGVRVNTLYLDGDTAVNDQSIRRRVGSLGTDFRGEKLSVSLDLLWTHEDVNNATRPFSVAPGLTGVPPAPNGKNAYPGSGEFETENTTALLKVEYEINPALNVYAGYGEHVYKVDGALIYPTMQNVAGDYTWIYRQWKQQNDRDSLEAGLRGTFEHPGIKHRYGFSASRLQNDQGTFVPNRGSGSSNIWNPVPPPKLDRLPDPIRPGSELELTSFALADTMELWEGRSLLTLGVRRQEVDSLSLTSTNPLTRHYNKKATSPVAGLVYKPANWVSLYASYVEGLSTGGSAPNDPVYVNANEQLAPYVSEQYEVGAKFSFGDWIATVAAYELSRPTAGAIFLPGPVPPGEPDRVYGIYGEQRARGAELSVAGQVTESLRLLGGLTLIDAKIQKSATPAVLGNRLAGASRFQGNLGAEWDTPFVPGLSLSARFIYTGSAYADEANRLLIPSWDRIDIGARYTFEDARGTRYTLRLNVDNLTDKQYWTNSYTLSLGQPRTWSLSLEMSL
ncbi:hypothetical protein AXK11_08895 [Cephaloticoccus primus]|uniref:TonB-dependent receptor n=1 Tax=Cephaloticoccus primus TaxID=1548207 RepID=A0A139SHX4_9BACT|nr:hypothetical protein AXK11_08895 [Cephaloticoccus primus]